MTGPSYMARDLSVIAFQGGGGYHLVVCYQHGPKHADVLHVPGGGWRWWLSIYSHSAIGERWATAWGAAAAFKRECRGR